MRDVMIGIILAIMVAAPLVLPAQKEKQAKVYFPESDYKREFKSCLELMPSKDRGFAASACETYASKVAR